MASLLRRKSPGIHAYEIKDSFKKEQMLEVLEMNGVRVRKYMGKIQKMISRILKILIFFIRA